VNNPRDAALWWFADGVFRGESRGLAPFVVDLAEGEHEVTCTTADGLSSSVRVNCVSVF
jgi:membrane carboxypeptidase/penicillin-binding protein PbpC